MLDSMFGANGVPTTTAFVVAAIVLLVIVLIVWAIRRRGPMTFLKGGQGRQPRLAVLDATQVDSKRRLVLVRRDHIEHLIMIGGPTDVVIESRIIRSDGTRFSKPSQAASTGPAKAPPPTDEKAPPPAVPGPVPMPPPPAPKPVEMPKTQPAAKVEPTMAPARKAGHAVTASSAPQQRTEAPKPVTASVAKVIPDNRSPAQPSTAPETGSSDRTETAPSTGVKPQQQPAAPSKITTEPAIAGVATAPIVSSPEENSPTSEKSRKSVSTEAPVETTPAKSAGDSDQPEPSTPAPDRKASDPEIPEVIPMPAPPVETEDIAEQVEEVPTLSKARELIGEFDQLLESELNKEDDPKETGQKSASPETVEADAAEEPTEKTDASQADEDVQQVKQASLEDEMKKLLGDLSTRR